jgi:hypothetical protein
VARKSHDAYVEDHAMATLVVIPADLDEGYVVQLIKPMPYANRITLVTMSKAENRKYMEYLPFDECVREKNP